MGEGGRKREGTRALLLVFAIRKKRRGASSSSSKPAGSRKKGERKTLEDAVHGRHQQKLGEGKGGGEKGKKKREGKEGWKRPFPMEKGPR